MPFIKSRYYIFVYILHIVFSFPNKVVYKGNRGKYLSKHHICLLNENSFYVWFDLVWFGLRPVSLCSPGWPQTDFMPQPTERRFRCALQRPVCSLGLTPSSKLLGWI